MANFLLTIAMLGVTALTGGGLWLIVKGARRRQGVLMIIAALVLLGNVLIWTAPIH